MKVVLLSGSIGKRSCTRTLLEHVNKVFLDKDVTTVLWDLAEKPLPIAIPEYHTSQHKHPDKIVREFVQIIKDADAYVLDSPLYHDSYSGVLKNALDTLPNEAFLHKPVGLVSHSSNVRSCVAPCNQLRPVVRSLGGYSMHIQVGTTDADYTEQDGSLELTERPVKARVEAMVYELIDMIKATQATGYTEIDI